MPKPRYTVITSDYPHIDEDNLIALGLAIQEIADRHRVSPEGAVAIVRQEGNKAVAYFTGGDEESVAELSAHLLKRFNYEQGEIWGMVYWIYGGIVALKVAIAPEGMPTVEVKEIYSTFDLSEPMKQKILEAVDASIVEGMGSWPSAKA